MMKNGKKKREENTTSRLSWRAPSIHDRRHALSRQQQPDGLTVTQAGARHGVKMQTPHPRSEAVTSISYIFSTTLDTISELPVRIVAYK